MKSASSAVTKSDAVIQEDFPTAAEAAQSAYQNSSREDTLVVDVFVLIRSYS